tara:strand:+ start:9364 stop:9993 length:630 start_codon:yes stop_codon:yes gene_type:complete
MCFPLSIFAQSITLKVLGTSKYIDYAESYGVLISVKKNDSLRKIQSFKDSIKTNNISHKITPFKEVRTNYLNKNVYKLVLKSQENLDKLVKICNSLNIKIEKTYFNIPKHSYQKEDEKAVLAFENAVNQAKIIAHNLNYKIIKVLNINDETSKSSGLYDNLDLETEKGQLMARFYDLLSKNPRTASIESSKKTRNGGYNLWITFEIKKK